MRHFVELSKIVDRLTAGLNLESRFTSVKETSHLESRFCSAGRRDEHKNFMTFCFELPC